MGKCEDDGGVRTKKRTHNNDVASSFDELRQDCIDMRLKH
jgi:hypothetical protein